MMNDSALQNIDELRIAWPRLVRGQVIRSQVTPGWFSIAYEWLAADLSVHGVQGVASSNPAVPTNEINGLALTRG